MMNRRYSLMVISLYAASHIVTARGELGVKEAPARYTLAAGDLLMSVEQTGGGLRLAGLQDVTTKRELILPVASPPLFALTLRQSGKTDELKLTSDAGWSKVQIAASPSGKELVMQWEGVQDIAGLRVEARAVADSARHDLAWSLNVQNDDTRWAISQVVFPQIAIAEGSSDSCVFFPRGPGEVKRGVWRESFRYSGLYPNGWTAMQLLAAYDRSANTGLYVALHDPMGSTKEITAESRPKEQALQFRFSHPVPDMNVAGNDFTLPGRAVWRLLRGDWFDAAVIYRDWVRKEARWYPERSADGRSDTPPWMRELCAWAMTGGGPKDCVESVKEFAKFLDQPVGFHWYNWHQIPFDNDYPHYFPTKPGFVEAVKELQAARVYVMPYINGRLWDTRDRGVEDFEFTRVALPSATKDEKGQPYSETYGSKETDGSRVSLGVMCPTTPLWRERVSSIVDRLLAEQGVNGVYIDQVAAASPKLCFDRSHGHPVGGGAWWNQGYWHTLDEIRRRKPEGSMLTTECNAEPFVRWFDGYLTWHWQYDGQVPAFPAVYGGALQMFGRAYRGGETKDLAMRMKAGQQLVFGEQIGWIHPSVVKEPVNGEFLRQVVKLRRELRRYFFAGEMARPPRLSEPVPTVRADWQWSGVWWVTTDAVLTGAWRLPQENKAVLLFVNVSDQPVSAKFTFAGTTFGLPDAKLSLTAITAEGRGTPEDVPVSFERKLDLSARKAWAWEFAPAASSVSKP